MTHLPFALHLAQLGYSVLPNCKDKYPSYEKRPDGSPIPLSWKPYQATIADEATIQTWFHNGASIGVVCGAVSANLELLDFDNKGNPSAHELYELWRVSVEATAPGLVERLYFERTKNDGYHHLYRCEGAVAGDQKLAQRPPTSEELAVNPTAKPVTLIETRGEGGQAIIAPSEGYTTLRGSLDSLPIITAAEREILLNAAKALNRYVEARRVVNTTREIRTQRESDELPSAEEIANLYNERFGVETLTLLEEHGWVVERGYPTYITLRRPGKKQGISATLGYVGPDVFYVFSSNAAPFEPEHGYSPFATRAFLKHDGDFKAATRAAAERLGLDYASNAPGPLFDEQGQALCPHCSTPLTAARNGNGWRCIKDGGEFCFWWKGDGYTAPAIVKPEASDTRSDDPRPRIPVRDLDIPQIVAPAWGALVAANDPPQLFRRDGALYELCRDDHGATVLCEVDKRRLRSRLARVALFVEKRTKQGKDVSWVVEPPSSILDDMLVRIDPRIPLLTRITRCPIMTADGSIIDEAGYHADARIYYDPRPGLGPLSVPQAPTTAEVGAARQLILDDLLGDFPFVDAADRAHAVALFLLPFLREAVSGPTPLHLIEAPTMGSGKTLLADVLLLPALGESPTPITEAGDDDEWRKRITSMLAATPPAIYIDNINRTLAGGAIAAALTATTWSDRLLGTNRTMSAPVRCVWLATANNPTLSGEVARRCIRIRIDPRVDRPWQRDGFRHPNLRQWVQTHQGELVTATLTLIRYGLTHGTVPAKTLGSFEHWTQTIGRILDAIGVPGFLGNLDELYDRADSEGAAWRALISSWWEKHQNGVVGVGDVFELYKAGDYDLNINGKDEKGQRAAFGKRLKKQQDRVIDGYQLINAGTVQRAQQWQLRPVKVQAPTASEGCEGCEVFDPPSMHVYEEMSNDDLHAGVHVENPGVETFTTFTTFTQPQTSTRNPIGQVDWEYIRRCLAAGTVDGVRVHCSKLRLDYNLVCADPRAKGETSDYTSKTEPTRPDAIRAAHAGRL